MAGNLSHHSAPHVDTMISSCMHILPCSPCCHCCASALLLTTRTAKSAKRIGTGIASAEFSPSASPLSLVGFHGSGLIGGESAEREREKGRGRGVSSGRAPTQSCR